MLKLTVAYKFSNKEVVSFTKEFYDKYPLEYTISRFRDLSIEEILGYVQQSENKITETTDVRKDRKYKTDALIFVDEKSRKVTLYYQNQTTKLSDYKNDAEKAAELYEHCKEKFTKNAYLHNREDLKEFLKALEIFNDSILIEEVNVENLTKSKIEDIKEFPVLVIFKLDEHFDGYATIAKYNYTLVDQNLGL